jgi:serine/threonine protein kinase
MSGPDSSEAPEQNGQPDEESGPDPLLGTVIADRYRVDEKLGVGGMGAVYRAEHVLMKKPVAVKVLHREMTVVGEVVKRFEREAIAAGRIDHPNVTVATDFGKLKDGSFYLVLEYVPGRSLSTAMKEDGIFSVNRALFIARQVAAGLGAAHAANIVHRDLKPDNIMLIDRGGTKDFVKVLDFGIAKVNEEGGGQLTRIGSVFGTPQYMAPEQAAGKPVDHRADLYSLGLVLYEMLAGKQAFGSMELVAILTKQLTEPPPPLPDSVDADVTALVMRLAEKDPDARVQTAQELVAWIDARLGPGALPPDATVLGVPSARGGSVRGIPAVTTADVSIPSSQRRAEALRALSDLMDSARDHSSNLARRVVEGDTLKVAGRDVPARALAGGAIAVLFAGALALSLGHKGQGAGGVGSATHLHLPPPEPELGPVIARAEEGDRPSLSNLESRPEAKRSPAEWMAIARGRARLMEYAPALAAFERAVKADESLASDEGMLKTVRRAADDDRTQKTAFDMCVSSLGAGGADVLFDVWASTTEKTGTTQLAKTLLDKAEVREHASVALRTALELRKVSRCDEAKKLVARAKDEADERAFRPLNALNSRRGCGFLGLADCFSCLRQGDDLSEALKAVQTRKGPRF